MIQFISKMIQKLGQMLTASLPVWLYIVVFMACVLFVLQCSCSYNKQKEDAKTKLFVGKTEWNGHSYVVFRAVDSGDISILHDEDCSCYLIEDVKL